MVKAKPDSRPGQEGHPSRHRFAGYLSGSLDEGFKLEVETHLQSCPHCAAALEEARAQMAYFADKHPTLESLSAARALRPNRRDARRPGTRADTLRGWKESLRGVFDSVFGWRPMLAGLALLAVGITVRNHGTNPAAASKQSGEPVGTEIADPDEAAAETESEYTAKGEAVFYLFHNGRQIHRDTLECKPSDTLQLGITSPAPVHYALLYRDDGGGIQVYLGANDGKLAPLGSPSGQNLPNSLILDQGWRREELYCLWSPQPFTLDEAKAAVTSSAKPLHLQTYLLLAPKP